MEDMDDFTPLPCNLNITVSDCDAQATTTLSSILAESAASNSTAVVPCGTCVVADLDSTTLSAPHGLDIQGMLYFPTSASGTLEATHIFVQGIWKIDPPASPTPGVRAEHGRVTVRLTGPDEDVYLTPHEHNAAACASSGGSCNVGKRPIAVAGGQLDIRGVEDSETCPSWVKLKSVVSELPPRPQPAPVYPAKYYVGYDKRACRNRDELGSFTDMTAMEECMAACDAAENCKSFEWGRFTPRICRLSTTCNYDLSYTNWKQKGWNLYVKDWANDPEHNFIGDYYVWPSYGQTGEVYPPVDPASSTSWIAHDGRSCAEQGAQIELSIKHESQDCALRCGLFEECTSFEYEIGTSYCRLYSSCSLDITGSNPNAKWFESVPDIYAFDETSMWNYNHTTHIWLFYNEPEYYTAGTVLDVGAEAASCWDPNGDLLLTNSQDVGDWSTTYTLPVLSRDSSAGTFHVDYRQDFIGDPFTLDTDPDMASEIASLSRPVVFDSVTDHDHWHPDYGTKQIHGGHLIVYHTPNVVQRIEGIQVQHFGQQGNLGRYPIHFHHSGRVTGSVVRNNIVRASLQRCVVVHASHDVLIENNVAFDSQGHCYITEDGVEEDNTFKDNLGVKNAKQTVGISTSDRAVSTFWITNPRNHFIGNVAAGSEFAGFWFEIGALKFEPIYTFRDNVSHNNGRHGIQLYPGGYRPSPHAYFFNCKIYNNGFAGMWFKRSENVVVMNSFFANNKHGIEHNRNDGISRIESTFFYPVPPSQVGSRCNDNKTGIRFALDPMAVSLKVLNSSFHGFGIVAPGCARTGYALQLSDIQDMSSTTGGMPDMEGLTFHPPIDSFGIEPDIKWDDSIIYQEDAGGTMTISGQPGFFVHTATYNQIQDQIQGSCSPAGGGPYMNETLWCEGSFPI